MSNTNTSSKSISGGILRWAIRGILGGVALILALIITGTIYESAMASGDAERYPAPGQIIQVNGRNMHLHCEGEGTPTVVLEAGANAWSEMWALTQPAIGKLTRTCSYDRAGYGWSAPKDGSHAPQAVAEELHDLLHNAGIQPPYVLVGHSMGGKYIRAYTIAYPQEVAGLIFVDARHESMEPVGRTPEQSRKDGEAYEASLNLYRILRQTGVARILGLPLARSLDPTLNLYPADIVYRMTLFTVRETTLQTMIAEGKDGMADDAELSASRLPAQLPIIVLSAESSLEIEGWSSAQQQVAALSNNSQWIVVPNTGHNIQTEQPQAIVEAVRSLIDSIDTGVPLAKQ